MDTSRAQPGLPASGTTALVLGAGISGLVSARLLRRQGFERVIVLDRYPAAGGNHINCDAGPYTFDIGTIIFQDDSPLLRHFPELLPLYHPVDPSISRITPDHRVRAYPVDPRKEIVDAGPLEWLRIALSVADGRVRRRDMRDAADFIAYWIGDRLATRTGISAYVERFYGVSPDRIDLSFARKRMGWIAEQASLGRRVRRLFSGPPVWDNKRSFVRPRAGFRLLYAEAVARLEAEGVTVRLGTDLRSIRRDGAALVLATADGEWRADTIVSTVPLDDALALCGLADQVAAPPTMELLTLFFSFRGERGFDTAIFYNFAHEGAWKRITMFSDFYGEADGRAFFGVEINRGRAPGAAPPDPETEADAFRSDVAGKNLFRGDLRFEGAHRLGNAYPVYRTGAAEEAAEAVRALASVGVVSIGRQGGFDYLPTARHTTLAVETALLGRHGPLDASPLPDAPPSP